MTEYPGKFAVAAGGRPAIVIPATLDTKAIEIAFVRDGLIARGYRVLLIDCGVLGEPSIHADISRAQVAAAAGFDITELRSRADREIAIPAMIAGLEIIVRDLVAKGQLAGLFGVGGGTNANFAAAAFRAIPFGVPKLLVSTVVSGNVQPIVGTKDVLLFHSVVDILGLNGVLRSVLSRAIAAMAAMVEDADRTKGGMPGRTFNVAVTAFGSTTPAANRVQELLSARGWEVLTFHARGSGGRTMEELVRAGEIDAVVDLTTTEVTDEIVGGIFSAGPDRLTAAADMGVPQVILPGAIDMVNFGTRDTIPAKFGDRLTVAHTPTVTLMRSSIAENRSIAAFIAARLNRATAPVGVLLPLQGFSAYDRVDGPFFNPAADQAFRSELEGALDPGVRVEHIDAHINDPIVADRAVEMLIGMIATPSQKAAAE